MPDLSFIIVKNNPLWSIACAILSGGGLRYEVVGLGELAASVTDDATTIKLTDKQHEMPAAQMAHLVLPDTRANTEKPKEPFFTNALGKNAYFVPLVNNIL